MSLPVLPSALRRFVDDTLIEIGTLDITDRREVERGVNLVQRLLVVLGEPAPQLHATIEALRHAGSSERRMRAAQLYRELAALVHVRFGATQGAEPVPA